MITMMALILAGGRGERLRPLTDKIPKPLLPVKGKPLLEWQVELLKKYRINEIMICGHYMFDKIKEYFGTGARFGVNIKYIYEEVPLGTGGAMKNAESEINSTVVVIYGDIFTDINIKNLLTFHKSKKADATIVLHESDHPRDSDAVEINGNQRITRILGRGTEVKLTKSSIYVLEPAVFNYMKEKCSFEDDVLPVVIKSRNVFGYVTSETIMDIGTVQRYGAVK